MSAQSGGPEVGPEEEVWSDDYDDNVVCDRCGGEGSIDYDDGGPSVWGEDCPSLINHLVACPDCRGTGARDGIDDDTEDGLRGWRGCLFPDVCCMPGDHYTSECHTPEDLMTPSEAKAYRRWMRRTQRERRRQRSQRGYSGGLAAGGSR